MFVFFELCDGKTGEQSWILSIFGCFSDRSPVFPVFIVTFLNQMLEPEEPP